MPFSHFIAKQMQTVYVTAEGPVNAACANELMFSLAGDPAFEPQFEIIFDLRRLVYEPNLTDLFEIRNALIGLRDKFRGRITVVTTEASRSTIRLASALFSAMGLEITITTSLNTLAPIELQSSQHLPKNQQISEAARFRNPNP
jgi:hypothetical protein